jgi:hypothetical protein
MTVQKEIDLAYARIHYPVGTVVGTTQIWGPTATQTRTIGNQNFTWLEDGRVLVGTVERGDANYSMALKTSDGWAKIIKSAKDAIINQFPIY